MTSLNFGIHKGTEHEKAYILKTYPHTAYVIHDGGELLLARKLSCTENEIIGFLWMFKRSISAPVEKYEWFINVIDVPDASNRRKGVADSLVREAIHYARNDGAYQISAYCDITNIPSHMLWRKNGFAIMPAYGSDQSVIGSFVGFVL